MSDRHAQLRHSAVDLLRQIELSALLVDASGRIRCVTPRLEAMLDCEPHTLDSLAFDTIFSPRNPDWFSREARRAAAEGHWSGDAVLRRRDGTECWAHVQACRLWAERAPDMDLLFIFEDTTESVEMIDALMRRTEELYDRNWKLETVGRIGRLLLENTDIDSRLYALLREAVRGARAEIGLVLVKDVETDCLVVHAACGETRKGALVRCSLPMQRESLATDTVRSCRTRVVKNVALNPDTDPAFARAVGAKSALSVPMCVGDDALGVLLLGTRRIKEFTSEEITLVEIIANHAALALKNALLGAQGATGSDDIRRAA